MNNPLIHDAVLAGVTAGCQQRWNVNHNAANYLTFSNAADAFATAVDSAIPAISNGATLQDALIAQSVALGQLAGRFLTATDSAAYAEDAQTIAALYAEIKLKSSGAPIGGIGYAGTLGLKEDPNSWIQGFLGSYNWRCTAQGANPPSYCIQYALAPDGALFNAVNCNDYGLGGAFCRFFVAPRGITAPSVRFELDMRLPDGIAPGFTTYLQIYASNQVTLLGQATVQLSANWQTASITLDVTPGTAYWIRVYMGNSNVLLGRLRVMPINSPDTFWSKRWVRYQVSPDEVWNHSAWGGTGLGSQAIDNQHLYLDPESSFKFRTNATELRIETYNTQTQFNGGWMDVLVNGTKYTKIRGALQNLDIIQLTLPPGDKEVEIVNAAQIYNGVVLLYQTAGSWVTGIYVHTEDTFQVIQPGWVNDTTVIYGTSKTSGFYAGGTGEGLDQLGGGIPQYMRGAMTYGRIVQKAIGSRALWRDYQAGNNSMVPLARQVIAARPTHIMWDPLRNDWAGPGAAAPWASVAAWSTQFQALIDFVNTALPNCQQYFVYTSHESNEGANAGGQTLQDFLTELDAIYTARQATYTTPPLKCDLRPLWTIVQAGNGLFTTDGVHPTSLGYGMIARTMAVTMGR